MAKEGGAQTQQGENYAHKHRRFMPSKGVAQAPKAFLWLRP